MSRAFDFVTVGVVWIVSIIVHRIAVELFAPEALLHALASDGTEAMNGAARADLWFEILGIWIPIAVAFAILLFALFREYRRQVSTAIQSRR